MKLFVYCAGGFGKELFDCAYRLDRVSRTWDEICFLDDDPDLGDSCYGARLFTFEHALTAASLREHEVVIATGEPFIRRAIYDKLQAHKVRLRTLIDPTAVVSHTATLGVGVVITPYCSVTSSSVLNDNVVLNTKSIVGHDITIGSHTVLSSMVNVGGGGTVGDLSYIGMGVQIREGLNIGRETIVGMGSVVHHDIPDGVIALGNPARPMKKNIDKRVFRPRAKEPVQ